jgi:hypothetical protein
MHAPLREGPLITAGLGLVLGAGTALLLRVEMPVEDTWGALFGVSLLAIGTAARIELSALAASFFLGLGVSILSRHRAELRALVRPTERPVLLPMLLLSGMRLDFHATRELPWIAGGAVLARFAAKIAVGWVLLAAERPARTAGPLVGLSLASSGALSMCIGLAFAIRFPGIVGDTVLTVAAISATAGEFVGPSRLRRTLQNAGEIQRTGSTLRGMASLS